MVGLTDVVGIGKMATNPFPNNKGNARLPGK